jgi:hypothetical protein
MKHFLDVDPGFRNDEKGIFVGGLRLESEHLAISLVQMLVIHSFEKTVI